MTLTINGAPVPAPPWASILQAARAAGIYIPTLCTHPDLPPGRGTKASPLIYQRGQPTSPDPGASLEYDGCRICLVEVEGQADPVPSCTTMAQGGLVVQTESPRVREQRQINLAKIMARHPHACLTCAQREGCSREPCSMKVPMEERCCAKLGRCELQRVADYVGIREDTPRYIPHGLPVARDEPVFYRDYNLCIGCTRCVRACRDLRQIDALGFLCHDGESAVGSRAPTLKESGCKFCVACVEVCPTGSLMFKEPRWAEPVVPCTQACPAGIDVPRYLRAIAQGSQDQAVAVNRERVPLPGVLGRVCFHPCEAACRRGEVNEPIAICALKRFATEGETGEWRGRLALPGPEGLARPQPTGKRVAVVGSGPAGLTAAYYLARKGHAVTIFEALPQAGGMLRTGIAGYRLPPEVLDKDLRDILDQGVELRLNSPVRDLGQLTGYDAVFLATGAGLSRSLNVEGMELEGVLLGVDFLRERSLGRVPLDFRGKRVVVIGGGNVAVDVARTARRLGAAQVTLSCLETLEEMPAHPWELRLAWDEGVFVDCSWGPKRILPGKDGKVSGIGLVRCTSVFDEEGRFNPRFDEAETQTLRADIVVLAIGQAADVSYLSGSGLALARGGTIPVDRETGRARDHIFAGGDVVSGPKSAIEAIAAGRKAASAMDKSLGGDGNIEEALAQPEDPSPALGREEDFCLRPRAAMPLLEVKQRLQGFQEVELGLPQAAALAEARRCLQCDLRLRISSPPLPPARRLGQEFTAENIASVPESEGVFRLLAEAGEVLLIQGTANLRRGLEERLNSPDTILGQARLFDYEEEALYTVKESERLQQFLQEHGHLPPGNEDLY